jgi:hypothetical protein
MAKEEKEKLTPEMEEYVRVSREFTALENRKKELRPVILEQFKQAGDIKFEGISFSSSAVYAINDNLFYDWVAREWPHHVRALTQDLICPLKFAEYHDKGLISYEELPEEIYSTTYTDRITPGRKRN